MDQPDQTPAASPAPMPLQTDEGVAYEPLDHVSIVNLATSDSLDAKRRELHVNTFAYSHVAENSLGQWIYRYDKD